MRNRDRKNKMAHGRRTSLGGCMSDNDCRGDFWCRQRMDASGRLLPGKCVPPAGGELTECCEDHDYLVAPFDCAGAVVEFEEYGGCDFMWGSEYTIGEACPLTCGLCEYDPADCVETCYDCTQWGSDMVACNDSIGPIGNNPNGCTYGGDQMACVCDPVLQQTATELPCCLRGVLPRLRRQRGGRGRIRSKSTRRQRGGRTRPVRKQRGGKINNRLRRQTGNGGYVFASTGLLYTGQVVEVGGVMWSTTGNTKESTSQKVILKNDYNKNRPK